jgi:hypothetical protein
MLIYARIILAIIILQSIMMIISGGMLTLSLPQLGIPLVLIGGLFAYLAYSNFVEASQCVVDSLIAARDAGN